MYCTTQISEDIFYVGANDRRLNFFENIFTLPDGISYNSFVLLDKKTAIFDTVDKSVTGLFLNNVAHILGDRKLDYVIITHMEPDHAASLMDLLIKYPEATVVGNSKTFALLDRFFYNPTINRLEITENDILDLGKHKIQFFFAPMVHWPEVMFAYDSTSKTLFSADAFGTFGALSGNVFSDKMDFFNTHLDEARRYYTNIVGKYGAQTMNALKKVAVQEINYICPLHGPLWRDKDLIKQILDKHVLWASYTPEDDDVIIYYGSIYGGTEEVANILAKNLASFGIKNIKTYDVTLTDVSILVSEAFRAKVLIFASVSYNAGLFPNMERFMHELKAHSFQNRAVALIENGSWALSAGKCMSEILTSMKNMRFIHNTISVKSRIHEEQLDELHELAVKIRDELAQK